MAQQDEMALVLANQQAEAELKRFKGELAVAKRAAPGLPTIVTGTISAVTGAAIGVAEGMQHAGDPVKKEAQGGYLPLAALVVGGGAAIAAGPNNPRARSAAVGVATAGATVLAYQQGEKEGVQIALERAKQRALAQKNGGGALPAGQPPAGQAQGAPAISGWRRQG